MYLVGLVLHSPCVFSCADDKGLLDSFDKVESVVILGLNTLKRKPTLTSGEKSLLLLLSGMLVSGIT